jgi:hypothetical protein
MRSKERRLEIEKKKRERWRMRRKERRMETEKKGEKDGD